MLAAKQGGGGGASSGGGSGGDEAPAPPSVKVEPREVVPPKDGVVLIFGSTQYGEIGKKMGSMLASTADETKPNLFGPHRLLAGFGSTCISFITTGCMAGHCVAIGGNGEVFTWGRNDCGQLGLGDTALRPRPTRVAALDAKGVTSASCGKAHTVFLTAGGELLACGAAKQGACGPAVAKRAETQLKPVAVPVGGASFKYVACGSAFNLAIDSDGDVVRLRLGRHDVINARACWASDALDSSCSTSQCRHARPAGRRTLCPPTAPPAALSRAGRPSRRLSHPSILHDRLQCACVRVRSGRGAGLSVAC